MFSIRSNGKACPSFAVHLSHAESDGVKILGHKVRWGEGKDQGKALMGGGCQSLHRDDDLSILMPKAKTTPSPKKKTTNADGEK